jgi:REP element-mobilizing transposase RayT
MMILLSEKFNDISRVMQDFKSHSAKEIINLLQTGRRKPSLSPYYDASEGSHLPDGYEWINKGRVHTAIKNKIWQKNFYDFNIYSQKKYHQKLDYMHENPVKVGLGQNPADWPYSSFGNYYLNNDSIIRIDKIEI